MLGLITHEPHFALLREDVISGRKNRRRGNENEKVDLMNTSWQLLHLCLVREYLDLEFRPLEKLMSFDYDLEHIVDDFIFLVFFLGNDFLPSLPFFSINNGMLDYLIKLYKEELVNGDGYLTSYGTINWGRFLVYMDSFRDIELESLHDLSLHSTLVHRRKKLTGTLFEYFS